MSHIRIIGVPMDLGADRRGVDMGPSAIRAAGLSERLDDLGYDCEEASDLVVPNPEEVTDPEERKSRTDLDQKKTKYLPEVEEVSTQLADEAEEAIQENEFPLILGGDHSIAIGSLSGTSRAANVGVIWFDAHSDFNTPKTTSSGNVHGMPLAAALGVGEFEKPEYEWARAAGIVPERVVLVGLRSVDDTERDAVKQSNVTTFTMADIDEQGIENVVDQALKIASKNVDGIHVSFDLDWIDPTVAPGVGTPVRGGATFREARYALEAVAEANDRDSILRSLEFVEVNPILDRENRTATIAVELAETALGRKLL
ncbi:arginase [Haladaptatus pallidirubidus]|uniref:Arginase n=1 Tax=Haladaptatus pallidirubidus TaxID=1008152 RepID=A0AAV3UH36_9EURY|nr:arginase [Haladaptatus pallidirubidus]